MAKSIRSKFRRKMRNVKREKYGKKELERLKGILGQGDGQDQEMKEIYKVTTSAELKQKSKTSEDDTCMEHDGKSPYDPKTKKDINGHYPVWMNQRAIRKHRKILKKKNKKKGKK